MYMERTDGISRTLRAPGQFELLNVTPDGDCFYNAVDKLLPESPRPPALESAVTMREMVADSLTEEIVDLYRMCASAGVEDFAWLNHHRAPMTLDEVRAFARKRGSEEGAGKCLWADEHAMRTVASTADAVLLLIDEQAPSSGSRSGRRRGDDARGEDSRFVMLGDIEPSAQDSPGGALTSPARCLILHRSRRQHFSPVRHRGCGLIDIMALPEGTRALWPRLRTLTCTAASPPAAAEEQNKRQRGR